MSSGVTRGVIEPALQAEFPGLRLDWMRVATHDGPSTDAIKARLGMLSTRVRGSTVVAMRSHPVPSAYRAFYRQIGLDPDTQLTLAEEASKRRLMYGEFRSEGIVADALTIALVETNVPLWAIDARHVDGVELGIRPSVAGDRLGTGPYADHLEPGRLVVADASAVHGLLFGEIVAEHRPSHRTREVVVIAVGVDGVPAIHVEEALWMSSEILQVR